MRLWSVVRKYAAAAAVASLAAVCGSGLVSGARSAAREPLTVVQFGGTFGDTWNSVVIQPFQRDHAADVRPVVGLSPDILAKLRAQKGNPQIDVVMFNADFATIAAREGLLDTLDAGRIPNLNYVIRAARVPGSRYANFSLDYLDLAYNTQLVRQPPASWKDMWRPEYKGKVTLPDVSIGHWAYFIAAINKTFGKGPFDADAGFAQLRTLRPNVLTMYASHDQIAQLLNQGQAAMGPWGVDRATVQIRAGAPVGSVVPREGTIAWPISIAIVRGSPHKALAEAYVNLALSAGVEKALATTAFIGPTNEQVQLAGDLAKLLPWAGNFSGLSTLDFNELIRVREGWADRWNREIK